MFRKSEVVTSLGSAAFHKKLGKKSRKMSRKKGGEKMKTQEKSLEKRQKAFKTSGEIQNLKV